MHGSRPSLHALTGVRFLAALHVVAFHTVPREGLPEWLVRLLDGGPSSVTLFFILSGFVLAYSYLGAGDTARVESRSFWVARLARVYPVYLLGLVLAALPFVLHVLRGAGGPTREALWEILRAGFAVTTLTQAWVPEVSCQWNCPGWSLSVEAFFYLLFPVFCLPVVRARRRGLWSAVGATLVVTAVVNTLWVLADQWLATRAAPPLGADTWLKVAAYNPLLRLPQFLLGVLLGRLFSLRVAEGRGAGPAASAQAAVAAVAIVAIFVAPRSGAALAYLDLALMPPFALLLWSLAYGAGPLARGLARPWVVRLGEASYALYILHEPLSYYARLVDYRLGVGLAASSPRAFFAVYGLVSVWVSIGVFLWVEEPARRWLRARLTRRPVVPSVSTVSA